MIGYMNPPAPPQGIAYVERDKKGKWFVHCPWCGKKAFPIDEETRIKRFTFKCKGSNCKHTFEVNV